MDRAWARETVTVNPLEPTQSAAAWQVPDLVSPSGSIPDGTDGLHKLALQGAWREVASRTSAFSALNPGSSRRVQEAAWHLLALVKLQMFQKAWELLPDVARVDDPSLLGEDGRDECPWVVRWLHAELPRRLSRPGDSLDATYALFALAEQQLQRSQASGSQASIDIWDRRVMQAAGSLMTQHLRARELKAALQWLAWADRRRPDCPHLKARIGYAQMVIGDITAAAATFQVIAENQDAPPGLVQCNKGLLLFSQSDFRGALKEFEGALAADPDNRMAGNNQAICKMYCCNLPGAIQALEGSLRNRAGAHLQETVLLNLASMYELSSSLPAAEAKAGLAAWAARVAPHDFDMSCIRTA